MKRKAVFSLIILLVAHALHAQVTVQVQAPRQTEFGQRIRVSYVVNTSDAKDFNVGEFEGFRVLYGPSTSSSSNISIINGKTTRASSLTYTYTLVSTEEGTFQLPVASVKVGGETYRSSATSIEVLPASGDTQPDDPQGQQPSGNGRQRPSDRGEVSGGNISAKQLYMTVTANKRHVYEQEAILLTYKLYTLVSPQQISGEIPQLDGFHVQEIDSKAQMSLKYERVDGRNYGTAVWRQYLLFPQKTGKLKVPPVSFDVQVEQVNTSMDPFDIFFGGGSLSQIIQKTIVAPGIEIDVKPLPTPKPASFSGAVGKFSISGSLTPEQLNANDAATLRLIVSGQGNMKLMKAPRVSFPNDFEVYDPKETDKTTNTSAGARGNKVFDYVVVPRHGGKYTIPPVEYSYFDTESEKYVTVRTDSFDIAVAKGKGHTATVVPEQEDLKVLNDDIRYIRQRPLSSRTGEGMIAFGTWRYWLVYLGLSLAFLLALGVFYRRARENANIAKMRGKKAGKAATKRLRNAARLMKAHDSGAFYDEVMHALIGYAGDKLNLPITELNKDNVQEILLSKSVDAELVNSFMQVLEECEFARYAPGDPNETMDKIFSEASEVINKLDAVINRR
ncbi:MAG: BatD family protein [Bacteroidaceae bacterium]|nr:BatD family protein [Bacteroidaceae bacterium]